MGPINQEIDELHMRRLDEISKTVTPDLVISLLDKIYDSVKDMYMKSFSYDFHDEGDEVPHIYLTFNINGEDVEMSLSGAIRGNRGEDSFRCIDFGSYLRDEMSGYMTDTAERLYGETTSHGLFSHIYNFVYRYVWDLRCSSSQSKITGFYLSHPLHVLESKLNKETYDICTSENTKREMAEGLRKRQVDKFANEVTDLMRKANKLDVSLDEVMKIAKESYVEILHQE